MTLSPGTKLNNDELRAAFDVSPQGGMRRSLKQNCLVLISDRSKGLYEDKWHDEILHYTGMGQSGDQTFSVQNKTLRDAKELGVTVHLCEVFKAKEYTYLGEVELAGDIYTEVQPDSEGNPRKVLMFPLKLKNGYERKVDAEAIQEKEARQAREARRRSTEELRNRVKHLKGRPSGYKAQAIQYERNQDLVELAKRLANGTCQLCNSPAPFENKKGEPYLEVHHIEWLAKGGEDTLENAIALCPNCHRKMHTLDRAQDKDALKVRAEALAAEVWG